MISPNQSNLSRRSLLAGSAALLSCSRSDAGEAGFHRSEAIFPLDYLHNHSSCIVECPNGDLLVCWYRGSGERRADDVRVLGARRKRGSSRWSEPFEMADFPGFPDCNPAMVIDPQRRLWMFWPVILANEWHTSLLMSKVSEDYQGSGAPKWNRESPVLVKPDAEFGQLVSASVDADLRRLKEIQFPEEEARKYLELRRKNGSDRYFNRMGWMPRAHPYIHEGKRLIVPLYSDGFDFSLMVYSDDWGKTWVTGRPLIGMGPVQPSIARKRDGSLATFFRDNGPKPQRLMVCESRDGGHTWTPPVDHHLPNPGSGAEVITLKDGRWALIYNDTEEGRHSLAVSLSDDDGKTWRWTRHLERTERAAGGSYHYPSLIQAKDGSLHASYTTNVPTAEQTKDAEGRLHRATIRHAHFDLAWVEAGDRSR